jgi:AraC family transcriptional regulator
MMGMRNGTVESYQERVQRVLAHIQNHLEGPLPLEELAGVAHFSPYHFHRIFRGMVGESVKEHVRRLRLERAARRLRFSAESVTMIALDSGYQAPESFTRAFEAMFGESPSSFRQSSRDFTLPAREGAPGPPLEVRLQRIGPLRLAFFRHIGPYDEVGIAWGKLMSWAGRRGLLGPGMKMLGIVHDDYEITPPETLRYDAALPVDESVQPSGELGIQTLEPREYAIATHRGPYSTSGDTYARLAGEWLPASGRELLTAPALEIYRNSPFSTAPEDLLTDIHLPLAPKE